MFEVKLLVGFTFVVMGTFVVTLNLVSMFPNPEYVASWAKVVFASFLIVYGVVSIIGAGREGRV